MSSRDFHIGQRLSVHGSLCTVRYIGNLSDTKGDWLGVEWDDPKRGKHDGTHKQQRVFETLSKARTSASFLKPTQKLLIRRTILEAIQYKYSPASGNTPSGNGSIEISGKTVEEVGFNKIQQQISQLSQLRIVLIDSLSISGLRATDSVQTLVQAQNQLAMTCPNIVELDVGWNLIETWQEAADLCSALPKLRTFKASGLRFKGFDVDFLSHRQSPFCRIEELHLNECLLTPSQIIHLLFHDGQSLFPSLKVIWLSQNELFHFATDSPHLSLPQVETLVLENNHFRDLDQLAGLLLVFPNVKSMTLQGNNIENIDTFRQSPSLSSTYNAHHSIEFLNIADNSISAWTFVNALSSIFPSLTSLRISKNPIYDGEASNRDSTTNPSDTSYYLTLARIPSLKILNYTTITPRDREEGEIYYLSVAEKEIATHLSTAASNVDGKAQDSSLYPLYTSLCAKYDREPISLTWDDIPTRPAAPIYPPGTLGARLINCSFYIPSSDQTFSRLLPPSLSVYTLKSLLHRHFHLKPLSFTLIYESPELDPVQITTTKLGGNDLETWGDWDVDIPPPSSNGVTAHTEDVDGYDEGKWINGYLIRNGTRFQRRLIEIKDGMRSWGDYLDTGVKDVKIKLELK